MKKLISAASALAMAASMVGAAVPFATGAADASKGFELRAFKNKAGEAVSTTISAEDIAAGDVTIPVGVYLTEGTADSQAINAQWTINSKDGDASDVEFTAYLPGNEYFTVEQAVGDLATTKIVTFSGTLKSNKKGVTFTDTSKDSMYSVAEEQKFWGCENAWGSLVWVKPIESSTYDYTGSKSDDYPMFVFEATFPKNTPAGTYTIEFVDAADELGVPANFIEAGNPTKRMTMSDGSLTVNTLDIVIGGDNQGSQTTASSATTAKPESSTTTTASGSGSGSGFDNLSEFPIDSKFVITGQDYEVEPGDTVEIEFLVSNPEGRLGNLFVAKLADLPAGITAEMEDTFCYAVPNDREYAAVGETYQAKVIDPATADPVEIIDGESIICFTFTIPDDIEPGEYKYSLSQFDVVEFAQKNDEHDISKFAATLIPGTITVKGESSGTTTQAPSTTTKAPESSTTQAPSTTTKAPESSTTKAPIGDVLYGDTNCDKVVNIADVVVLNKWLNDAKSYNITDQGKVNADCCDEKGGEGLDKNDSDAIIKSIVHLVELPCSAADLK
ncbi:MAG: hypothetical protein NC340_01945 [Ruminococcus flavefaciens]|nr:hypothetical protein [Ruminococcus flavefaciens]MCM1228909.1 hypothetical protein [Ruminococcus flavefaciens]